MEDKNGPVIKRAYEELAVAVVRVAVRDLCTYQEDHHHYRTARLFFKTTFDELLDFWPYLNNIFNLDYLEGGQVVKFIRLDQWLPIMKKEFPERVFRRY